MKMKISDILRKSSDETMAKIIGAVIAMQIDGISDEEAVELEYPHTLETLQSEMDVDYTPTNADRIRSMSDEELAKFLQRFGTFNQPCSLAVGEPLKWLKSEVEE